MSTQVEPRGPCLRPSQAVPRDTLPGHSLTQDTCPHSFPRLPNLEGPCPTPLGRFLFHISGCGGGRAVASHLGLSAWHGVSTQKTSGEGMGK